MLLVYKKRAEDGTRIRDPNLGKVVLYQLSYFRNNVNVCLVLFVSFCICLAKVGCLSILLGKVALYQLSYFRV